MTKTLARLALAVVLTAGFALTALAADDVTLSGKVVCAHCQLKKADAKGCQNVLVVTDAQGSHEYYLAKNEVSDKFGHVCMASKNAKVTGQVTEKDGKKWLTASAMEEVQG